MLKLEALPKTIVETHRSLLAERFEEALVAGLVTGPPLAPYVADLFDYLWANLDKILIGSPGELVAIAADIEVAFPEFHRAARERKKAPVGAPALHANTVSLVERCFDYDKFAAKQSNWGAYSLVANIGARLCPYCHLHHVNYHLPTGSKAFSLRPPLDHYLPRTRYPYLSVSLSNLIPCCFQCNSSVKLAMDPLSVGLAHPRDKSMPLTVGFSAKGSIPLSVGGTAETVTLTLTTNDAWSKAHLEAFKLVDRYQWYRHEVYDLMRNYEKYLDYPEAVQRVLLADEFVLGFERHRAKERAIGLCLLSVYDELKKNLIA